MTSRAVPHSSRRALRRARTEAGRGPRLLPLGFFIVVVMAVFFLMIFLRIALDRTAFELDTVQTQITKAETRQLDLRLELARLQDPLRIDFEARQMGMTYPDQRLAVVVEGLTPGRADIAPPVVETPAQALEEERP
ncbi:MAG: cell division protein FtsL [Armatimonadetes bacterium]|nr:MAG: cell division protein FtsL [Armatimonadota bacterium]